MCVLSPISPLRLNLGYASEILPRPPHAQSDVSLCDAAVRLRRVLSPRFVCSYLLLFWRPVCFPALCFSLLCLLPAFFLSRCLPPHCPLSFLSPRSEKSGGSPDADLAARARCKASSVALVCVSTASSLCAHSLFFPFLSSSSFFPLVPSGPEKPVRPKPFLVTGVWRPTPFQPQRASVSYPPFRVRLVARLSLPRPRADYQKQTSENESHTPQVETAIRPSCVPLLPPRTFICQWLAVAL